MIIQNTLIPAITLFEQETGVGAKRNIDKYMNLLDVCDMIEKFISAEDYNMYWEKEAEYGYGALSCNIDIVSTNKIVFSFSFQTFEIKSDNELFRSILINANSVMISKVNNNDEVQMSITFDGIWDIDT